MRAGVGYREFAEIAKCAFVDVSTNDFGLRGRPTNISRVAVMTGLTRKEVKRLRDKIASGDETAASRVIPPTEILHQWYSNPDFIDESGRPKPLPFDGEGVTFTSLVKQFGGDIPPGAMRTELKRVDAVSEDPDGTLTAIRRHHISKDLDKVVHHAFGQAIFGLAHAVNHNMSDDQVGPWVERVAWTTRVRDDERPRVRRVAQDRAEEFVQSIDDLFAAYETINRDIEPSDSESVVGIGVFYFESDNEGVENFRP